MSDVKTIVQRAIEVWRTPTSGENDLWYGFICQALQDLRAEEFFFNVGDFTVTTVAEQADYGLNVKGGSVATLLRWDFYGVLGRFLHFDVDGSNPAIMPRIESVNPQQMERQRRAYSTPTDCPTSFSFSQTQLTLWPAPANDGSVVHGRCLLDLETPRPQWDGADWEYLDHAGNAITTFADWPDVGGGETHAWFEDGFWVLLNRVAYHYFSTYRRDDVKAQQAAQAYVEARRELRRNTNALDTQGPVEPMLGIPA